jgi:hypothetical protein
VRTARNHEHRTPRDGRVLVGMALGVAAVAANGCDGGAGSLEVGTDSVPDGGSAFVLDATVDGASEPPLTVTIAELVPDACGPCVELTARVDGGTAPYSYAWSPAVAGDGGEVEACPSVPTTYTVRVTDSARHTGELPTAGQTRSATAMVSVAPACGGDGGGGEGGPVDATSFVYWVDWQSVDGGTVFGTVSPPTGTILVTYAGEVSGLQTTTGTDEFTPASTFTSPTVTDPPPGPGMIEVSGATTVPDTVTFSAPVTNPVIAIYNLGTSFSAVSSSLVFSVPFTILSSGANAAGTGYWGSEMLVDAEGGVSGVGSNGVVELEGTLTTFQWTNPSDTPYASFTGLTLGVRAQ